MFVIGEVIRMEVVPYGNLAGVAVVDGAGGIDQDVLLSEILRFLHALESLLQEHLGGPYLPASVEVVQYAYFVQSVVFAGSPPETRVVYEESDGDVDVDAVHADVLPQGLQHLHLHPHFHQVVIGGAVSIVIAQDGLLKCCVRASHYRRHQQ